MSSQAIGSLLTQMGVSPEEVTLTVDFRDASTVYMRKVKRPTFLYDKSAGIWLKYGEYEDVLKVMENWKQKYISTGFREVAEDLALVEVPTNQTLIDRLFQRSGEFTQFISILDTRELH